MNHRSGEDMLQAFDESPVHYNILSIESRLSFSAPIDRSNVRGAGGVRSTDHFLIDSTNALISDLDALEVGPQPARLVFRIEPIYAAKRSAGIAIYCAINGQRIYDQKLRGRWVGEQAYARFRTGVNRDNDLAP